MEQYISKSALVAEIKSKRKYSQILGDNAINSSMQQFYDGMEQGCVDILSSIDNLEIKEAELEKNSLTWKDISAIRRIMAECRRQMSNEMQILNDEELCKEVLKRFKAQKGEEV